MELTGDKVTSLTLPLHELATNAAKHGSLVSATGHVDLSWCALDARNFCMIWQERCGPAVTPPAQESGADIADKLIAASNGALHFDWQAEGLIISLSLPMVDG